MTQNTAWGNVEKAITNLKRQGLLSSPERMKGLPVKKLARLIKPAGYYNLKARRLKNLIKFLSARYGADLKRLSRFDTRLLGKELLSVNGIGPETRDSILLYAFNKKVFVVDAYTKRVFARHGFFKEESLYETVQKFFTGNLPKNAGLYNEYHALIVRLAKDHCRKKPLCDGCPLREFK